MLRKSLNHLILYNKMLWFSELLHRQTKQLVNRTTINCWRCPILYPKSSGFLASSSSPRERLGKIEKFNFFYWQPCKQLCLSLAFAVEKFQYRSLSRQPTTSQREESGYETECHQDGCETAAQINQTVYAQPNQACCCTGKAKQFCRE